MVIPIVFFGSIHLAVAQPRAPLKPSPDLFAADIGRLIGELEAAKASETQLNSARALYIHAKADGLSADLSPTMQLFIQASTNHDQAAATELLGKMSPFELGEAAYVSRNYGMAQKYWLPLAQSGDVAAQLNVGLMYSNGANGATQSDSETFKWYRLAATQGSEVAQENLAVLFQEGRGVTENPKQVFVWLSLAAEQAVSDGHNATSISLINRRDKFAQQLSPEDRDQALKLVTQCSASQYKDCE
jgi:TPR repeat protein